MVLEQGISDLGVGVLGSRLGGRGQRWKRPEHGRVQELTPALEAQLSSRHSAPSGGVNACFIGQQMERQGQALHFF